MGLHVKKLDQGIVVSTIIGSQLIDVQSSFFKMSTRSICMWAVEIFGDLSLVTIIWQKLSMNALMASRLYEFHKLAKRIVVKNMGTIEDERVFSTMSFMKTKLRIKLVQPLRFDSAHVWSKPLAA